MAVAATGRYSFIVLLFISQIVNSQNEYKIPDVTIQALSPKGIRIFIPDNSKLSLFAFNGKINKPISQNDVGEISAEITTPKNGMWIYEDPHLELKVGDVINYYVFVVYDRAGYVKDKVRFTVTELVSPDNQPSTIRPTECRPTVTRLRVGTACSGQTIFEDNFNSLREDLWQIEQYIPDQPEYPFVSYQRPPNAETVTIDNGYLRIEPKLQQEQDGFSEESLYTGSLNLFSGCTRTAESCSATAMGASILPPVVSGRLTSKSFAFTYGIVEVRAKLPQGDWLYPEILLESLLKKYGTPKFASGVIKIAGALGNRDLRLGPDEYGNKILYGGPIMNLACREVLTGRKELFNGPQWGDQFHVYSVQWTPDHMIFSVDGEEWLRVEPTASGLKGRFNRFCDIPRTFLSFGTKMAPFDDHFQLTLGVAAGGITEFKDDVITGDGHPKPWNNRNRKASYNFWRDLPAWKPTWSQPALQVDYVKVIAL
ncbi:Beta-1,3-glucan-binding protein [Papilio machaon]|uniref:Beta-1,3-glucan-binding protein n=1 Tax=Papilio machaon TaxID=76193 RepID=A0A0N1IPG2_PAPMA|nr:Beta-1,3-glucan-binding protein [Papilio machaon]